MMVTASPTAAHGHPAVGGQTAGGGGLAPYDYASPRNTQDDQTLRNTIANSYISSPVPPPTASTVTAVADPPDPGSSHHYSSVPVALRPGGSRYDDWDSTRRPNSQVLSGVSGFPPSGAPGAAGAAGVATGPGGPGSGGSGSVDGAGPSLMQPPPTRTNTLKKRSLLRRSASLHRNGSRRSVIAGSVRSLALQPYTSELDESHSAFYCPVPTKGSPTDALATRFQAWRKILKDLIAYHREIQNHYEQRAKSVQKLAASLNAAALPPGFLVSGGLDDATQVLRSFHKQVITEATKAHEIEDDIILALTGLRSDLNQKIKEIKNIAGDFRNSVDKEMDATRKAVKSLQDVLGQAEMDASLTTGRQDPYLLRLAVDRQLDRQLQEENYLHQAYLNIEKSGRELESIVVGEIQRSYNTYAGILKREAGLAYGTVDELRAGPVAMPKDEEWMAFIQDNEQFVDPELPVRSFGQIHYPGQDHSACQEIRAGLLERKSKYLKSYTAGWYVLSPTHLHEFRSADKMQAPIMSLYLPEQKLGSHSSELAKSSKFVLKGRQMGAMHRGHTWVFRAESFDTMMAWYADIQALTERSPQERNELAIARSSTRHSRSVSRASEHTYSSDGLINEDDDDEPFATGPRAPFPENRHSYSVAAAVLSGNQRPFSFQAGHAQQMQPIPRSVPMATPTPKTTTAAETMTSAAAAAAAIHRPSPGGRFPSDLPVNAQRGLELQAAGAIPLSPTSGGTSGTSGTSGTGSGGTGGGSEYTTMPVASGQKQPQPQSPPVPRTQPQPQSPRQQPSYAVRALTSPVPRPDGLANGYFDGLALSNQSSTASATSAASAAVAASAASTSPTPQTQSSGRPSITPLKHDAAAASHTGGAQVAPVQTSRSSSVATPTGLTASTASPAAMAAAAAATAAAATATTSATQTPSSGNFRIPGGFPRTNTADMN